MTMETGWIDADGEEYALWNESGLPTATLSEDPDIRRLTRALTQWRESASVGRRRGPGLFDPGKFAAPDNPYQQMRVARRAVTDDDVVAAAIEVTEGLALQAVSCESSDENVTDIFNQLNAFLDLDTHMRVQWRELETYSQSVNATLWGWQVFRSRVKSVSQQRNKDGSQRTYPSRKEYRLYAPRRVITLDPTKVVPVGGSLFGEERLAWHAARDEYDMVKGPSRTDLDPVMAQLVIGTYTPSDAEAKELSDLGVDPTRLLELDPRRVWRHSVAKPAYERFPEVRMRSIFRLLDLKQQLLAADRVALVGNANYILLVRKGDKEKPGTPAELGNLQENFRVMASLPVIISDHRLQIDIITPSVDHTLQPERYDLIDRKIIQRLLGGINIPGGSATAEGSVQSKSRMIARALESRRLLLKRSVERHIISAIWDHPYNAEVLAEHHASVKPSFVFTPRHVQLDNDSVILQTILTARQAEELSRHTFLEFLGIDQEVEAMRREMERRRWPDWEQSVPFSGGGDGSGGAPPQSSGARGGRPAGGGQSPKSASGQVKQRTSTGAPSTGGSK